MIRALQVSIFLAVAACASSQAETIEGPARVVDGDGLRIGDASIRLFGIDAVEADQVCNRGGAPRPRSIAAASAPMFTVGASAQFSFPAFRGCSAR